MDKIIVPTDFSANSKTGMRFAIQLAQQRKVKLIFLHAYFIPKPYSWSDQEYQDYSKARKVQLQKRMEKFVSALYARMKIKRTDTEFLVHEGISAESVIRDCAIKTRAACICICTRGAGKMNKVLGTTAGNLITQSPVPVLSVPKGYRWRKMDNVVFACDMENVNTELQQVVGFVKPLKANLTLLHFIYPGDQLNAEKKIAQIKKSTSYPLKFDFSRVDISKSLVKSLRAYNETRKPSLLVMFTNQKRSFVQKIFLSSKSEEMAFQAKVPLLVFGK